MSVWDRESTENVLLCLAHQQKLDAVVQFRMFLFQYPAGLLQVSSALTFVRKLGGTEQQIDFICIQIEMGSGFNPVNRIIPGCINGIRNPCNLGSR